MYRYNLYGCISGRQASLKEDMRLMWLQHVYWTRMLLISIAEHLKDLEDVTARLLQNPRDIADIFAQFYRIESTNEIRQLLTVHLEIGADLITALRDNENEKAEELDRRWYINADEMSGAFSSINPYYEYSDMREMFYTHLDLTKIEVAKRLAGSYKKDIEAFDAVEREAIMMADVFTDGIVKQFSGKFS